jgi:diguanylate cyclase (GGDEF)-like protein/PAS domain S-box-containing protein
MTDSSTRKTPLILVVDDDAIMRLLAVEALAPGGLRVIEAAEGDGALDALRRQSPDLVLLDVQMPGCDGFAVCEAIRRHPPSANTPVVMMTGLDDVESILRAYEVGATDFVTKPINWLILAHRVRYLLRASANLAELRRSQERLSNAQKLARMGSWQAEVDTGALHVSDQCLSIFDLESGVFSLKRAWERVHPEDRPAIERAVKLCARDGTPMHLDHRIVLPNGIERIIHLQAQLVLEEQGQGSVLEGTVQDVTERKRAEEQIQYLAYHDSLTGLGNRRLFQERVAMTVSQARRNDWRVGVIFLDLDHFKRINDTLGHSVGDLLLQSVADRLVKSVRETDVVARPDLPSAISRLGGDEFTILLSAVNDPQDLAKVARRILDALAPPFQLGSHEVVISGSIGITAWPEDGDDAEALLRNADTAMYHAKEQGRNNFQFYAESMNDALLHRLVVEGKLRRALEQDELELQYQPKVSLVDGRVSGFEGLLRWHDPEIGLVMPGDFIGIAEETGLINPIGGWVLRAACRQIAAWTQRGFPAVPVSVNVSAHQFRDGCLVAQVRAALADAGVDPARLELEFTESMLMHDEERVIAQLEELRALGVRIALDDFGTGYSSLSYLSRLPVDVLKVDRSFVEDIGVRKEDVALGAAIVSMGKALGLSVIAEGVEREEQRDLLRAWGCDEIQGYLVSKALPPDEVERFWRR